VNYHFSFEASSLNYRGKSKGSGYSRQRRGCTCKRSGKVKPEKFDIIKELSKYTLLTPEGRQEFIKTVGVLS
jgi:hypothetical protein